MSERTLSGRCHCGAISYTVKGNPVAAGHCYCKSCQRLSGAGHSTAALFPESSFEIRGTPAVYSFEPAPGVVDTRLFCGACGSQVLGKNGAAPGMMAVSLGSLDDASAIQPSLAIYVAQKAAWDAVDGSVRSFEGTAGSAVKLPK